MPMTIEQRRARQSDLRFQKHSQQYQSRLASIQDIWARAKHDKLSHDAILKLRKERILDYQDGLPLWIVYQLTGAWDVCQSLAYRLDLVFCYAHPDTGTITDASELCHDGFASRIDMKTGHHYWKNDDGTFTHAF